MGLTKCILGHYLELCSNKNTDLVYGIDDVRGVNNLKQFGDEIDRYTMDQAVADGLTVSIKYHPRIAKVLLDNKKVKEIENYYKKCADDGATYEEIEVSKKAMSSMEIILGEPSRLERLATDIHNHYVASCAGD